MFLFYDFSPEFKRTHCLPYLFFENNSMASLAVILSLLLCLPFESIGSPATGLVVVGGESAELWTPDTLDLTSDDDFKNLQKHSAGKEFSSCTLPPPPSPMYGHTLDLVNNTLILVHADSSYQLNSHGWTQGPNTTYNRYQYAKTIIN